MRFNEEKHIYTRNDEIYTSATALIKKFSKPFDRIKRGKKAAKDSKRSLEEVLADWDKLGQDAIKKGVAYHKIREQELLDLQDILIEDEPHPIHPCLYEDGDKVTKSLKLESGVYPELIVWSDRYKIAGQADRVEITKSGRINIKDYKTSKEIRKNSFKLWNGRPQMMAFPLSDLEDCNYNIYALQLNLYAYLIKAHNKNLKIGELTIEHVVGDYNQETNQFEVKDIQIHIVENMQDNIKVLLEYWKNQ